MTTQEKILQILENEYKDTGSALKFGSVFQLLIAVILSAQTNDNQVNKITEPLFAAYPDCKSFCTLSAEELEQKIKTCGLYKNKAQNIVKCCHILKEKYNGEIPQDRDLLMQLPGVGRKTANVVLSVGFGIPALAVDTHVFRVSHRLGLAHGNTPDLTEKELCEIIPRDKWAAAHHWLIWHGRKVCSAKSPQCVQCKLAELCPAFQNECK